ncbi:class I SAM-dependent methyltransferase [Xanthobacter dioxanivorans]|uniref:Class I SAM-dependent methyltransferase n=1 Tax=Xanthobacter dioxanivorans TaxID=2528964 RepID=A0A974PRJ6_9HYPH|nr:class I SAM-dependent methyltransferase [Xanthobacter dioxanivorans]QRG08429.1 class I SAM-dependent methyltransferase [Xanthobacter dioxanivorans]
MRPKPLGFSPEDISRFDDAQRLFFARAVTTVLDHLPRFEVDDAFAARSAGDTTEELFIFVGLEWVEFLISHCRLLPDHAVLEIGSGAGRIALPLSRYLLPSGLYFGLEADQQLVDFCTATIPSSNFTFDHFTEMRGTPDQATSADSNTAKFPYPDQFFDVVFASSVFSRLPLDEAILCLREITRVLKPGGRALLSAFAITRDLAPRNGSGITERLGHGDGDYMFRFKAGGGGFYTRCGDDGLSKKRYPGEDPAGLPVAFDKEAFVDLIRAAGLIFIAHLPGAWSRHEYRNGYHDIFLVERS